MKMNYNMSKIVFVHIPKTGGKSFKAILKNYDNGFIVDNRHKIEHTSVDKMEQRLLEFQKERDFSLVKNSIGGHFLAMKWSKLQDYDFKIVTWLRDPIERLKSHYTHWKYEMRNHYLPEDELHIQFLKEDWDFMMFAKNERILNMYNRVMNTYFSEDNFDFVGIQEWYNEEVQRFSREILDGRHIDVPYANKSTTKKEDLTDSQISELKDLYSEDYRIYNKFKQIANEKYNTNNN